MKKKIFFLTITTLIIYLSINIYQKITNNPKKQFLESIKYLSNLNIKLDDNIKYTSDINIKLTENISNLINLNDKTKNILEKLKDINATLIFQKENNNYELELNYENNKKKITLFDSNIYYIDKEVKYIENINKILENKKLIEQSIIKNLSYKYFETKEIIIDEEKINKITLNLDSKNIEELLNNIYNDLKDNINIEKIKIPKDLEIKINTYNKENKNIKTEIEINNFPKIKKILIEIQNKLININLDNKILKIKLDKNIEILFNDKEIMTITTKNNNNEKNIIIDYLGILNNIKLKKEENKNIIKINSNFLNYNLINIDIEENNKITNDVKINNPTE